MKKNIFKFGLLLASLALMVIPTFAHAEWWAKNAAQSLVTNDGSGLANADIHVRNCYIGLGTATPCAIGGGGLSSVLASGKIFVGNASNVATGVNLTLSATPGAFSLANTGVLTMPNADTSTRGLLSSTDWNTFNNKFSLPALTNGSVIFSNGTTLAQDNTKFFWDDTNNYLGLGMGTTPAAPLDVQGVNTTAVLGSEMITLAADRDFSSDTGNWTGTNWTIGSGVATHTAGANNFTLTNSALSAAPVAGQIYKLTFSATPSSLGSATIAISFGGVTGATINTAQNATATTFTTTSVVTATNTNPLTIIPNANYTGTIDNISVQLITPTNATQIFRQSDGTIGSEIRSGGTGRFNNFIGYQSGLVNTTGSNNVATGYQSLMNNTTGSNNVATGYQSLMNNTTANLNVAIGSKALRNNLTGAANIAIGNGTMSNNIIGASNVALGWSTLSNNVSGQNNFAVGGFSMSNNTTGSYNVSLGGSSSNGNTTGQYNIVLGQDAFSRNTTGSRNIVLGYRAGYGNDNPIVMDNNILIGYQAADTIATGATGNIVIGHDIDLPTAGGSNQLTLGNLLFGTGLTSTGTTVSSGSLYVGATATSTTARFGIKGAGATSATNALFLENSAATNLMLVRNDGNVGISNTAPGELLSLGTTGTKLGVLSFAGNTSGKVIVQPAAAAGSWSLTLPVDDGNASDVLTTDGSGVTSWAPAGGGTTYTFSTGLTNTASTITANLSTGIAGGQTAFGGTAASENLLLQSTTNATRGYVGITYAPTATQNYGLLSMGSQPFDGTTGTFFLGNADGTVIAGNFAGAFGGSLIDMQLAGVSKFRLASSGDISVVRNINSTGNLTVKQIDSPTGDDLDLNSAASQLFNFHNDIGVYNFEYPAFTAFGSFNFASITGNRTYTWPDATGVVALIESGKLTTQSFMAKIRTISTSSPMATTDYTVLCDATGGNVVLSLPAAAGAYNSTSGSGQFYTMKKIDGTANSCKFQASGAETIDGANTYPAVGVTQYASFTIQSDGTSWWVQD